MGLRGLILGIGLATIASGLGACSYSFAVVPVEKDCTDLRDNDGDDKVDCEDPDCAGEVVCQVEWSCDDDVDNDGDGRTDCADPDCKGDPACAGEANCWNGLDDDGDGTTDCSDLDCADQVPCLNAARGCDQDGQCEEMPEGWDPDEFTDWEDRRWCIDCQVVCLEPTVDVADSYEYIANKVELPVTKELGTEIGFNMDGDPKGNVDNDLASVLAYLNDQDQEDFQQQADELVQNGEYILLFRAKVAEWPTDEAISVQIFDGDTTDATEDNLTGHGEARISSTWVRDLYLCGDLREGKVLAGPGKITLPIPIFYEVLYVKLDPAWILTGPDGYLTETEGHHVIVAGGADRETMESTIYPELAQYLTRRYHDNPDGGTADFIRTWVDGRCTNTNPGCQNVQNGVGDCAPYDGTNDPVVTATEVQCSALGSFLQPKLEVVNSEGKVVKVFTFAVRVNLTHVDITNLN